MDEREDPDDLDGRLRALAVRAAEGHSPARARQLVWVAGELTRFAAHRTPPPTLADLLGAEVGLQYLELAGAGALRARGGGAQASTAASNRTRRACLLLLARAAGLPEPDLDRLPLPPLAIRISAASTRQAGAELATESLRGRQLPTWVRHALVVELIADTGMRVGELAALEVGDVDLTAKTVTYVPRPPAARSPQPPRTVALSPAALRAVRAWLPVRARLTELTPRTSALLVSVHGNHDGDGVRRPPGLPLQPRGLARAHRRAVATLNARRATAELVPGTLGLLRPADQLPHP
ncbi:site-specific integrase [Cellulomonas cellasea]|uniref:site-specific integrase n=1 Tax=Cellulomonas cellasea TaxID=43670 RepID=UPI0025A37999|nr:site-specific integrase [Cellulomonas cellasea]MDM8085412.1 site-specific integrase [Cellulomonas cellasea]